MRVRERSEMGSFASKAAADAPVSRTIRCTVCKELFEKEYLQAQMTRFTGNISRTAQFIGMERSALHRKLKQLGLDNDRDDDITQEAA